MVPPGSLNYFYQVIDSTPGVDCHETAILTDENAPTTAIDKLAVKLDHGTVTIPKINYREANVDIVKHTLTPLEMIDLRAHTRPKHVPVVRVRLNRNTIKSPVRELNSDIVSEEMVNDVQAESAVEEKEAPVEEIDNYFDEDDEERKRREASKYWSVENSVFSSFR